MFTQCVLWQVRILCDMTPRLLYCVGLLQAVVEMKDTVMPLQV